MPKVSKIIEFNLIKLGVKEPETVDNFIFLIDVIRDFYEIDLST